MKMKKNLKVVMTTRAITDLTMARIMIQWVITMTQRIMCMIQMEIMSNQKDMKKL